MTTDAEWLNSTFKVLFSSEESREERELDNWHEMLPSIEEAVLSPQGSFAAEICTRRGAGRTIMLFQALWDGDKATLLVDSRDGNPFSKLPSGTYYALTGENRVGWVEMEDEVQTVEVPADLVIGREELSSLVVEWLIGSENPRRWSTEIP